MRKTFKYIFAALAATAALVACTKEITPPNIENEKINPAAEGSRVIAVSFASQTKTYLAEDGLTPKFADGDSILISNGEAIDTCEVNLESNPATISTDLEGPLTAVYPYQAAKMKEGNEYEIDGIFVSTVQDGTFASANICMAENILTEAVFQNQTAVFKIAPNAGNNTKYVEVITAGPEIANSIPTGETPYTKKNKIHVATTTADTVYVSILVPDGLKLKNLSFADGSNMKTVNNDTDIATNTIYTIKSDTGWDRTYVEIGGLKWATVNIGANTPQEYGQYFQWGEITGHVCNGITTGSPFVDSCNFQWATDPFNNGSPNYDGPYFETVRNEVCPGGILALQHDAANANWGGSWRMPTGGEFGEFQALNEASTSEWTTSGGVNGWKFTDKNDSNKTLFFPAAGYGNTTFLSNAGTAGNYWSGSLISSNPSKAYRLFFSSTGVFPQKDGERYDGRSIRALSD